MTSNKTLIALPSLSVMLLPFVASASQAGYGQNLYNVLGLFNNLLNMMIGLMVTLAIVVFFWGVVQYMVNVGEGKADGLRMMFYGVIVMFLMVSIWGIIRLLQGAFGVTNNTATIPQAVPLINR